MNTRLRESRGPMPTTANPVSRKASAGDQAEQWWPVKWQGIANFAEARGCANAVGRKIAAPVLPDPQRKGLVRQRSLSDDKRFWFLLSRQKEQPSGN